MNEKKVAIMITVGVVLSFVFVVLLVAQFPPLWSLLSPRAPRPEIRYGEFNFRLEYEYQGELVVIEDIVIVEYGGTKWNAGSLNSNVWNNRLASGSELIELYRSDTVVLFIPILNVLRGDYLLESTFTRGAWYREIPDVTRLDINLNEETLTSQEEEERNSFFSEDIESNWQFFSGATFWHIDEDELFDTYGIRLISFECDPPIENNFK